MLVCPACKIKLVRMQSSSGLLWICPACGGRSATVSTLRKVMPPQTVNTLWQTAKTGKQSLRRKCPACTRLMNEIPVPVTDETVFLDVCTTCHCVWFDTNEYDKLPKQPDATLSANPMPQKAREAMAMAQLELIRDNVESRFGDENRPDVWWHYIPAFLGMPVENHEPVRYIPFATWIITIIIATVSIISFGNLSEMVQDFGMIPDQAFRYGGLTFLTSFFLHAEPWHLFGNLYFFLIFGDNVEEVLGRPKFILLLLLSSLCGSIFHILGDVSSTIPCIGASGGISGILAYYALSFPRSRIGLLVWLHYFRLPTIIWFAMWVALQMLGALPQLSGMSNISSTAHLGGALAGVLFWLAQTKRQH